MTQGINSAAGFADSASWDEFASSGGATDFLPLLSEGLTQTFTQYRNDRLGSAAMPQPLKGTEIVEGPLVCAFDVQDSAKLLEYALGSSRVSTFTYYETAAALRQFHLYLDRGGTVYRVHSCRVENLAIRQSPDEAAQIELGLLARTMGIDSGTSPATLSPAADPGDCTWGALTVRVGDKGDALGSGDVLDISGLELQVTNPLARDPETGSGRKLLAPERSGFREVTLRLDFPRQSAESRQFANWKTGHAPLQVELAWNTSNGLLTIGLLHAVVRDGANSNVSGPGVLTDTVTLEAVRGENTLGSFASLASGVEQVAAWTL